MSEDERASLLDILPYGLLALVLALAYGTFRMDLDADEIEIAELEATLALITDQVAETRQAALTASVATSSVARPHSFGGAGDSKPSP